MATKAFPAYICDRCGKVVESKSRPSGWISLGWSGAKTKKRVNHDLCGDCYMSLQGWLTALSRKG